MLALAWSYGPLERAAMRRRSAFWPSAQHPLDWHAPAAPDAAVPTHSSPYGTPLPLSVTTLALMDLSVRWPLKPGRRQVPQEDLRSRFEGYELPTA